MKKVVRYATLVSSLTASAGDTRRRTRRIVEQSSDPDSGDALPKQPYQELPEAFRQRHCISIDITELNPDGFFAKLDNGFIELVGRAIGHRYPTLEFSSTTSRTTCNICGGYYSSV